MLPRAEQIAKLAALVPVGRVLRFKDAGQAARVKPPVIDLANRTARFVVWDDDADREGDVLPSDLLDVSEYEKNPVLMFNHSWRPGSPVETPLPVGECILLERDGRAWVGTFKFYEAREVKPGLWVGQVAEEVWQAVSHEQLRTVSIGFMENPGAVALPGGGTFYRTGAKLVEVSVVPVPAKPSAILDKTLKRIEVLMSGKTKGATTGTNSEGDKPAGAATSDGVPSQDHESLLSQHGAHVAAMGALVKSANDLHEQMKATHAGIQQTHAEVTKALGKLATYCGALSEGNAGEGGDDVDGDTSDVGEGDAGKQPEGTKAIQSAILKMAADHGLKVSFKGSQAGAARLGGGHLGLAKTIHKAATSMLNRHMAAGGTVDAEDEGDAPGTQTQAAGAGNTQPGDPGGENEFPKALAKRLDVSKLKTIGDLDAALKAHEGEREKILAHARTIAKAEADAQAKIMRDTYEKEQLGRLNPI